MKKFYALLFFVLIITCCLSLNSNCQDNEVNRAKQWLVYSIEHRYRGDGPEDTTIKMYTKQYQEYKSDAINTEFDGLTQKQFEDKWKHKYNLKFVTSNSMLIGQQDWSNIIVTKCVLKSRLPGNSFMFSTVIEDDHDYPDVKGHLKHKRDIKVIPYGNSYLIDDILEYD